MFQKEFAPSGCFLADSVVLLEGEIPRKIIEVGIGDRVMTWNEGVFRYSPVSWMLKNENRTITKITDLVSSQGVVTVVQDHLLPFGNKLVSARSMKPGDTCISTSGNIILVEIVEREEEVVSVALVTKDPFIVVNRMVFSSYSAASPSVSRFLEGGDSSLKRFHNLVVNVFLKLPPRMQESLVRMDRSSEVNSILKLFKKKLKGDLQPKPQTT